MASTKCCACGVEVDAASDIHGDDDLVPADGDFAVCLYCAAIGVYENDSPREPTVDERDEAPANVVIRRMQNAVWTIKQWNDE